MDAEEELWGSLGQNGFRKGLVLDRFELFELLQNWDGVRLSFIGEKENVTIEYGPEF